MNVEKEIFKNGSTTYYWSSKFFPKKVRDDVFKLYSFVRIVDDYVDKPSPDVESFAYITHRWKTAKKDLDNFAPLDDSIAERVLQNIVYVVHRFDCDPAWVDAFLDSMKMDIDQRKYKTIDDTLEYIYGSAEVIGLFMAKILNLPEESYEYAKMQGRAMQFINFIRDIDEDIGLGRQYFPVDDLKKRRLNDLSSAEALEKPEAFQAFINQQIHRYKVWQAEADKGLGYIPKRLRVAVQTAVEGYNWTATQIEKKPTSIYEKKIKPQKKNIINYGVRAAYSSR
jgi:phytoene synthase